VSEISPSELPRLIEMPLLRVDATTKDIEEICRVAREQKLYGVCVPGSRVELAVSLLEDTEIKTTALVGLLGMADSDVKRYETEVAIDYGAQEIEVSLNIGRLKDGDQKYVLRELRDVAEAADERVVKVEIRPHLLTQEEILLACELIVDSGCHFVFLNYVTAAKIGDVKLCREAVGPKFGVKAGESVLDTKTALAMVAAGASRLSAPNGAFPSSAS
jgi:deoxyribose-phosphate aldolase